jgi:starch phosphorylase
MSRHPEAHELNATAIHIGNRIEDIASDLLKNLFCMQGKFSEVATLNDWYLALAYTVRDRMMRQWIQTASTYFEQKSRTVVYLSAEFLLGPQLEQNIAHLGIYDQVKAAVERLRKETGSRLRFELSLDALIEQEEEPGLGNGGLGRLAACYMDSLATLQIPTIGYGLRYEFGIFDQEISPDGWQIEITDKWLRLGNPWAISRPEITYPVQLGGHTEPAVDETGRYCVQWIPDKVILGTPHDTPVLGYGVYNANMLRLWSAEACESFDFQAFNTGDYYGAVDEKIFSENITKVLYPNDEPLAGKQLRLAQQYFFVSCSLQDMIRIYLQREQTFDNFPHKYAVQLNDTHPAVAIAELMRLFVDEHRMDWEPAWEITRQTFAYTNHTLLPEALETWSMPLFAQLLPRHLEIIYEINRRFLQHVQSRFPDDAGKVRRLSLIDESGEKWVRMAHLACVGSHAINGVAQLHTELLKQTVLKDFYDLWPEKFRNKTNGVTPRRFMALANPGLAQLISAAVGGDWLRNLDLLRALAHFAADGELQEQWQHVKLACKHVLAERVQRITGIKVDPASLFDIQVKRIHEYKRQHLNVLYIVTLYRRLKAGLTQGIVPRTFLFGGKAAPGYFMAKLIIRLINGVAEVVNADPDVNQYLRVVFFPNFNVKNAQYIYPAADLSEQISTAGKEASGTGNMKFSLNGALTIGTLDGANIEIREAVGPENFFCFGLTADEVARQKAAGYRPRDFYERDAELRGAIDLIASGIFARGDRALFQPLVRALLDRDDYMLCADYPLYLACQEQVNTAWRHTAQWTTMSILNVARMGYFSSDRAITEYCEDIWKVAPVRVEMSAW